MKNILLIDGYNFIYRARAGFSNGEYGLVYTFFRMLRASIERHNPDQAYFVLEGVPKQRIELSTDYKGTRTKPTDTFLEQKSRIIELMHSFPLTSIFHPDHECDDVLAALAEKHADDGDVVTIVSTDTDFYQLLGKDRITIYSPIKKKYMNESFGYDYVSWKSLTGDKADNIVGFHGIGNKRAQKIIATGTSLSNWLSEGADRKVKYDRNYKMIKFEDVDLSTCKSVVPEFDQMSIHNSFRDLQFWSIINDRSWNKFVGTFCQL